MAYQKHLSPDEMFANLLAENRPNAYANIRGDAEHPHLYGIVKFYDTKLAGVLVEAEIFGLPSLSRSFAGSFFGFHIHENGNCRKPFDQTGGHYNPDNAKHPDHAGDLPPLLGNHGFAYSVFFTQRFLIKDILGKSIIIHSSPDDFTSQPSGNSGTKIACGIIEKNSRSFG